MKGPDLVGYTGCVGTENPGTFHRVEVVYEWWGAVLLRSWSKKLSMTITPAFSSIAATAKRTMSPTSALMLFLRIVTSSALVDRRIALNCSIVADIIPRPLLVYVYLRMKR